MAYPHSPVVPQIISRIIRRSFPPERQHRRPPLSPFRRIIAAAVARAYSQRICGEHRANSVRQHRRPSSVLPPGTPTAV